jgi:Major Facilitator Superfamily
MATTKSDLELAVSPASDASEEYTQGFHYVRRGEPLEDDAISEDIAGYDAARMKARTALTFHQEKKLLRRIDWHIMPIVSIMFLLKNIDYSNASNARIMNGGTPQNILKQLHMSSNDFNWVSTIYYLPYIIAEAPSNLFIKRLLPSKWLSRIVVSWGIVLACHAAVSNKSGLYAARFFLGLAEAGMFPGVILQMTYWYRPDEMSLRLLYFCECTPINGSMDNSSHLSHRYAGELLLCHQWCAGLCV